MSVSGGGDINTKDEQSERMTQSKIKTANPFIKIESGREGTSIRIDGRNNVGKNTVPDQDVWICDVVAYFYLSLLFNLLFLNPVYFFAEYSRR